MGKSNRWRCVLVTLALLPGGGEAGAQLFGLPYPRPTYRTAPRHRATVRPLPAAVPEIPMPQPRPHFASDPPPAAPPTAAKIEGEHAPQPGSPDAVPQPSTKPETATPPAASANTPPLPPEKPAELATPPVAKPTAGAPQTEGPGVAPSGATNAFTPRQPETDAGCLDRLKAAKVAFEPIAIGPQPDARCTVVQPVKLTGATLGDGGSVAFPDRPTIACTTAETFAAYVHDLLSPLAKGSFGTALTTVWTGPGLECRSRDNIVGAKLSAHGQGLAVDIAQIRLADGRTIEVGSPKDAVADAFETAARAGACGYFPHRARPGIGLLPPHPLALRPAGARPRRRQQILQIASRSGP